MKYLPPYTITPAIVNLVAEIGETIGRYSVLAEQNLTSQASVEMRRLQPAAIVTSARSGDL